MAKLQYNQKLSFAILLASEGFRPRDLEFYTLSKSLVQSTGNEVKMFADVESWNPPWFESLLRTVVLHVLQLEEDILHGLLPLWRINLSSPIEKNNKHEKIRQNDLSQAEENLDSLEIHTEICKNVPLELKEEFVKGCLIALISVFGRYDARVRSVMLRFSLKIGLAVDQMSEIEIKIPDAIEALRKLQVHEMNPHEENSYDKKLKSSEAGIAIPLVAQPAKNSLKTKLSQVFTTKNLKIGTAALVGGALIGVTGGLAAPAIGAGLASLGATLGVSSVATIGALAASSTGVIFAGTAFTAAGAALNGYKMSNRLSEQLSELWFHDISTNREDSRSKSENPKSRTKYMSLWLGIHGWLDDMNSIPHMWNWWDDSQWKEKVYVIWEREYNSQVGNYFKQFAVDQAWGLLVNQVLMHTALASLLAAISLPQYMRRAANMIDNPWAMTVSRAKIVGRELARLLISKMEVNSKPITLYAYSVGCIAVFSCLDEVFQAAAQFENDHKVDESGRRLINPYAGLIENVILIGAPIVESVESWKKCSSVASGLFVNYYSSKDWILSLMFRSSGNLSRIAGVNEVLVDSIINIDLSKTPVMSISVKVTDSGDASNEFDRFGLKPATEKGELKLVVAKTQYDYGSFDTHQEIYKHLLTLLQAQ